MSSSWYNRGNTEAELWKEAHFKDMKIDNLDSLVYQPTLDIIVKESLTNDKLKRLSINEITNNSPNIYNSDGTLTGNRIVDMDNNNLSLINSGGYEFEPYVVGDGKSHLICDQTDFIGSGNPGCGFAIDGGSTPSPITWFNVVADFGGGRISQCGYSDENLLKNNYWGGGPDGIIGFSKKGGVAETIFLDGSAGNVFAGTGQTTLTSNAVVLANAPPTNNGNFQLLSRNSVNGGIELIDMSTLSSYADDASAGAGGLTSGQLYQNTGAQAGSTVLGIKQ